MGNGLTISRRAATLNYASLVRAIVRYLQPGRCPPRPGSSKRIPELKTGTLWELFVKRYQPLRLMDCSASTIGQYHTALNLLADYHGEEPLITDLCDDLLAGYMRWLLDLGRTPSTVNGRRIRISTIWRFANEQGLIDTIPRVKGLREYREEPNAWSLQEVGRILESASRERGKMGMFPAPLFWRAVILTMFYTLLRRGTLFKLRQRDVDLDARVLSVPPHMMKNRRRHRNTGAALSTLAPAEQDLR